MECRICGSTSFEPVLDLGMHPWCNHFLKSDEIGKEPKYPLNLIFCNSCHTAQLDYTVKKEIMFGDHTYLSGMTQSLRAHFQRVANRMDSEFEFADGKKTVLDIGSNDGTQLRCFLDLGFDVLGVESSKTTAKIAQEAGVPTLNRYFNEETADDIGRKFNVINAAGVFFHLEELHSVCRGIRKSLSNDGVFVVQCLYIQSIMDNLAFDQVYHEHLLYYSLETLNTLLSMHGLELFDASLDPIHGGTIIGLVGHSGFRTKTQNLQKLEDFEKKSQTNNLSSYQKFAQRVARLKDRTLKDLHQRKDNGRTIFGLGAPVKGNTILNYFDIGTDVIDCLTEINPLRQGLYSPGKHIPVLMETDLETHPDTYFVLAWNFKDEILRRNASLVSSGVEFYFPISAGASE